MDGNNMALLYNLGCKDRKIISQKFVEEKAAKLLPGVEMKGRESRSWRGL